MTVTLSWGGGIFFEQKGQWSEAEKFFLKALKIGSVTNEKGTLPARTSRLLSRLYAKKREWTKAFVYAQAAIDAVSNGFDKESARPSLTSVINGPTLVESLRWKADLWYQVANVRHDTIALRRAIYTYLQTFWLADQWQTSYRAELSKLFFQQEIRPAYRTGLQAIYEQWNRTRLPSDLQQLLQVQEQSKAAILAEQQSRPYKSLSPVQSLALSTDPKKWQANLKPETALLHYSIIDNGVLLTILRKSQSNVLYLAIPPSELRRMCNAMRLLIYTKSRPFSV